MDQPPDPEYAVRSDLRSPYLSTANAMQLQHSQSDVDANSQPWFATSKPPTQSHVLPRSDEGLRTSFHSQALPVLHLEPQADAERLKRQRERQKEREERLKEEREEEEEAVLKARFKQRTLIDAVLRAKSDGAASGSLVEANAALHVEPHQPLNVLVPAPSSAVMAATVARLSKALDGVAVATDSVKHMDNAWSPAVPSGGARNHSEARRIAPGFLSFSSAPPAQPPPAGSQSAAVVVAGLAHPRRVRKNERRLSKRAAVTDSLAPPALRSGDLGGRTMLPRERAPSTSSDDGCVPRNTPWHGSPVLLFDVARTLDALSLQRRPLGNWFGR